MKRRAKKPTRVTSVFSKTVFFLGLFLILGVVVVAFFSLSLFVCCTITTRKKRTGTFCNTQHKKRELIKKGEFLFSWHLPKRRRRNTKIELLWHCVLWSHVFKRKQQHRNTQPYIILVLTLVFLQFLPPCALNVCIAKREWKRISKEYFYCKARQLQRKMKKKTDRKSGEKESRYVWIETMNDFRSFQTSSLKYYAMELLHHFDFLFEFSDTYVHCEYSSFTTTHTHEFRKLLSFHWRTNDERKTLLFFLQKNQTNIDLLHSHCTDRNGVVVPYSFLISVKIEIF